MAIPRETVEQILQTARIEEVVGPFHNEKTPSFSVNPARNIFKCFGCGKAGDSAKFLMEHEHYTYPEALRYLAKKYNIKIEEKEQTSLTSISSTHYGTPTRARPSVSSISVSAATSTPSSRSSISATTPPNGMPSPNTPRKTAIAKSFWSR